MPRPRKPARLYLRPARSGRGATWTILDGAHEFGTGCSAGDRAGAEAALRDYLSRSWQPPSGPNRPGALLISEALTAYLREWASTRTSSAWIASMAEPVLQWWGAKSLAEINGRSCRAYVNWRTAQPIRKFKRRP